MIATVPPPAAQVNGHTAASEPRPDGLDFEIIGGQWKPIHCPLPLEASRGNFDTALQMVGYTQVEVLGEFEDAECWELRPAGDVGFPFAWAIVFCPFNGRLITAWIRDFPDLLVALRAARELIETQKFNRDIFEIEQEVRRDRTLTYADRNGIKGGAR